MIDTYITTKARQIASVAHKGQLITGTEIPYIVHLAQVAGLVQAASVDHLYHSEMVAAAWLHDILEDTNWLHTNLEAQFGSRITNFVFALTDQSSTGNRDARKREERERLCRQCDEVKVIKLADIISNLNYFGILKPSFAKVYLQEKEDLIEQFPEQRNVLGPDGFDDSLPLWDQALDMVRELKAIRRRSAG